MVLSYYIWYVQLFTYLDPYSVSTHTFPSLSVRENIINHQGGKFNIFETNISDKHNHHSDGVKIWHKIYHTDLSRFLNILHK